MVTCPPTFNAFNSKTKHKQKIERTRLVGRQQKSRHTFFSKVERKERKILKKTTKNKAIKCFMSEFGEAADLVLQSAVSWRHAQ